MGVQVLDLTTLDPVKVAQFDSSLTTLIQEYNPDLELRAGVFHELLLHLKAILDAADETNIDLVRQSSSLLQVIANPSLADADIVNALLSNYNIVRNPGSVSSGTISVVLTALVAVVIPRGSVFIINGLSFAPTATYAARTSSASVISDTDVLITPLAAGQYVFTIPVTALAMGSAGNVLRGTVATPASTPPRFLKAYAGSDFSGGTDADTNQALLDKLAAGLAVRAWSSRPSIEGLMRAQAEFANIANMSIIGFGDPEMLRDMHSIWPGHTGGRSDLYLRSQPLYQDLVVTKTASLVSKIGPLGTWQLSLSRDDAPGFYLVDRVLLTTVDQSSNGFAVTSDVRNINLSGLSLPPPDIVAVTEGVYSRYQTATIQFADSITDATPIPVGGTQSYNVVVRVMPLIADAQDFWLAREHRPPMCDVEVKAVIPCFTTVAFTVDYNSATAAPDVVAIQNTVANAVNELNFPGSLASSFISQVLHGLLTNLVAVTTFTLAGVIHKPSGATQSLSDSQEISIPNDPADMVTGRTTVFFLRPQDVTVTLVAVDVPNA